MLPKIYQLCSVFTIAVFGLSTLHAATGHEAALGKALVKIAPAVTGAGTIDYKNGCASCAQVGSASDKKNTILYSKDNDKKIELTQLSEDDAFAIFTDMAMREDIPFEFLMDGCYARAHKMVRVLEANGIIAGKAFIEGELYADSKFGEVGWRYQVAPVIMVKKGNAVVPYVLDPSLFSKPVPQTEWKAKIMSKSKSKFTREYYTNRFAYDTDDRMTNNTSYSDESLEDMEQTNRNFSRMLYTYHSKKKKTE